ncbi:MAG TPA: flagellin [Bryobacteraceae bacterium]|nr:flagellin [Bryobacteraceae bacterium]
MISIQTNYAAMVGEMNLSKTNTFQTNTIEQLTSGYRINSSGDDPAGLAVANQYGANVAQLTQGVINGNSGLSALQIIDGGLSNISTMLNRLQTLATEAASGTFTGNRATVQNEFTTLMGEIDREADNVGLGANNSANAGTLQVYIGGGSSQANSSVQVGPIGQVNSASLGLTGASVTGSTYGVTMAAGAKNLNNGGVVEKGASQTFAVAGLGAAGTDSVSVTVNGGDNGITATQAVQSLNAQLQAYGVTATITSSGTLQFQSAYSTMTVTPGAAGDLAGAGAGTGASLGTTNTTNALAAVALINSAIQALGVAQGAVGAGENDLNYAMGLANSQITNFSSAESQIKDADIATEAANLTRAQVLEQASVAAMAQANAQPQAVLKLLQ